MKRLKYSFKAAKEGLPGREIPALLHKKVCNLNGNMCISQAKEQKACLRAEQSGHDSETRYERVA